MNHKQIKTGEYVTVSGIVITKEKLEKPAPGELKPGSLVTLWVPHGNHEPQEA